MGPARTINRDMDHLCPLAVVRALSVFLPSISLHILMLFAPKIDRHRHIYLATTDEDLEWLSGSFTGRSSHVPSNFTHENDILL